MLNDGGLFLALETEIFLVIRLSNLIQLLLNVTNKYVQFATGVNKEDPAKVATETRNRFKRKKKIIVLGVQRRKFGFSHLSSGL